jgi:hypothetical protein
MRTVKYLVAMLAIASLATIGCSKDESKKTGEPGAARPGSQSAGSKAIFALFPEDTNMVVGINLAQISSSQLYKQFVEPKLKAEADKEFAEFKAECGFDPLTTVKEVVVGGVMDQGMEAQEDKMIVVVKGISRQQLTQCAEKMAQKEDKQISVSQEGKFTKVEKDGETTWIGWLDDTSMAMSPKMDKAMLEQRMSGAGGGANANQELMALVARTDQNSGLWLAMQKPAGAESPGGVDFKGMFASISLSGGLKLDAGIRQNSPDEASATTKQAKEMLEQAKAQAGAFGKYLSKVEISASDADVLARLSLSDAELQEILAQVGPMLGAMLGGGF